MIGTCCCYCGREKLRPPPPFVSNPVEDHPDTARPGNTEIAHVQETVVEEEGHVQQNASYCDVRSSDPSAPPSYNTVNKPDTIPPSYEELFNSK